MNKKLTFLTVLLAALCLTVSVNAQGRIDLGRATGSGVVLQSSDFNGFNSTFSFNSIESDLISNEKGQFSELFIDGSFPNGNVGEPQLPMITRLIAIPDGATPVVTVGNYSETEYKLSDYGIGKVSPMQAPIRKNVDPSKVEYAVNEAAYARNSYNDDPIAMVEVLGTMRGLTLGRLIVQPVRYNPAAGTIKVFNDVNVKVNFQNGDAASTAQMFKNTFSPAFNSVYDQIFNIDMLMGGTRDAYTDHPDMYNTPVRMLVICYSGFKNNSALNSWLQWKLQKGYFVDIYYTDETGTSATNIKNFIKTKYQASVSAGNAYTYLIVIGDTGQVPQYMTKTVDESCASDLGYSSVNFTTSSTTNYFPDMYYSRMSVENTTHLTNYINKVLTYERYEFSDGGNYLNNVILVGGWDSNWTPKVAKPTINYATNNYFNTSNTTYGGFGSGTIKATVSTSSTAGYSGSNNGCYQGINNGACFVNYTAHGDKQEWYQPKMTAAHVASLTNTGKYFFGVGNCCLTGNFNNTSTSYSPGSAIGTNACFAETMIRVPNAGAVAYVGCSPYSYWYEDYYWAVGAHSYSTSGNPPSVSGSTKGVYDVMFMDQYWNSASALMYLGNLAVQQAVSNNNTNSGVTDGNCNNSAHYYFQFYHTFGDGSVMPFITKPETNNVTIGTVVAGSPSMTVNAVAGSYVAVTNNTNTIYGVGVANSSGVATVNFTTAIPSTGTLYVVVTRQQYQPYFGTATITSGTASEYTINVSASPTNGGTVTGGGTFSTGTTRTVTATANTGYTFTNWTENGSVVSTNASYSFTLNYDRNLVANFAVQSFTVNAQSNPAEGGSVALAQGGKSSKATLTYDFEDGTQGWTVLKGTTGNSSHNWMHNTEYPTSNNDFSTGYGHNDSDGFMLSESYISGSSSGSGTAVTPDNYLVSPQVALGGSISFYAGARNTSYCAEKFSVMVSTTNNTSTASFTTVATWTLSLSSAGYTSSPYTVDLSDYSGMGYIAIRHHDCNDQWFLCVDDVTIVEGEYVDPSTATGTFNYGQTCVATATPNTGYHFVNWTENNSVVSSNATYSFNVTANRNLVANFSNQQTQSYTVNVSANPTAGGTVNGGGTYSQGQSCTVTATANNGYTFTNWTENGSVVSSNASYTFTVNSNRNLVANFSQQQTQTYTVTLNSGTGGTITPNGTQTVNEGGSLTFTVNTLECYTIASVTVNGTAVTLNANNQYTITNIHGNQTVNVTFNYDDSCSDCNVYNEFSASACDSYTWNGQTYTQSGDYIQTFPIGGDDPDPTIVGDEFFYDFDTTPDPNDDNAYNEWMIIDSDSDGENWGILQGEGYGHNSSTLFIGSYSYDNDNGALTPDNWIIMPQCAIGSTSTLSFYACGLDPNYASEYFGVYVATTETLSSTDDFTELNAWTATGDWTQYTVDLSSYAGQNVYLAFRHYNVTDMFVLAIDDISLTNGSAKANIAHINTMADINRDNNSIVMRQAGLRVVELALGTPAKYEPTRDCDSIVTLHLTINNSVTNTFTETACDSYTWHGQTYTTSGTYTYNGTTATGCSLTETLNLTINNSVNEEITQAVCDSYEWHGQSYTETGDYTYTSTTPTGCSLTETLHLYVSHGEDVDITEEACDSYEWHGTTYSESGEYTFENTTSDCSFTETLHLTINESPVIVISGTTQIVTGESTTLTASGADSYVWSNGETTASITVSPNETTTYTVTGTTDNCQSTAEVTVEVTQGVKENAGTISVFPNPVDNIVTVAADNIVRVRLYDITGQLILDNNESGNAVVIDMSGLAKGQYLLQVSTKTNVVTQKLVKK